jgi:hypothetical protein
VSEIFVRRKEKKFLPEVQAEKNLARMRRYSRFLED